MQFSCLVIFLFGLSPSICCGVGQTSKLYRLVKLMLGLSNDNCLKKNNHSVSENVYFYYCM